MARDHARLKVKIWDNKDFLALRWADQHAYLMLTSSPRLTYCGVLTFVPALFEDNAPDLTPAKLRASVAALAAARFVVHDDRTQELLIRSYVRHDGVLDRINMGKACGSAFELVASSRIREAIGDELRRLMADSPGLPGWKGLAVTSPTAHAMACGMP